jgi:hypothetical protein
MATVIFADGTEWSVSPSGGRQAFGAFAIRSMVGEAIGIFLLHADLFMLVDLAAARKDARRNVRAIALLRRSAFEPLGEVHGAAMLASPEEIDLPDIIEGFNGLDVRAANGLWWLQF